uniref:Uncharacterized protein n=1 Tax=Arundo donax TaxID=35708 RepID=A0A0A8YCP9_ARUDO
MWKEGEEIDLGEEPEELGVEAIVAEVVRLRGGGREREDGRCDRAAHGRSLLPHRDADAYSFALYLSAEPAATDPGQNKIMEVAESRVGTRNCTSSLCLWDEENGNKNLVEAAVPANSWYVSRKNCSITVFYTQRAPRRLGS